MTTTFLRSLGEVWISVDFSTDEITKFNNFHFVSLFLLTILRKSLFTVFLRFSCPFAHSRAHTQKVFWLCFRFSCATKRRIASSDRIFNGKTNHWRNSCVPKVFNWSLFLVFCRRATAFWCNRERRFVNLLRCRRDNQFNVFLILYFRLKICSMKPHQK